MTKEQYAKFAEKAVDKWSNDVTATGFNCRVPKEWHVAKEITLAFIKSMDELYEVFMKEEHRK